MSCNRRQPHGFTVPELIVAMTVGTTLLIGFMIAISNQLVLITKNNAAIDMASNSQNLLRTTVEALRVGNGVRQTNTITDANAPVGGWNTSNSSFVIVIATPSLDSSRNYITDPATGSPYMNELVYYKDGDELRERRLAHPSASGNAMTTSCPPNLATASCPSDKVLGDYFQSMSFSLFDQDNNSTSDPAQARHVKITLVMQRSVFGSNVGLTSNIAVTLRNRF